MKRVFKLGLAGTMCDNFDGGKYDAYAKSAARVKALCEENNAAFCHYPKLLLTTADAVDAAAFFEKEKVDFLLIQTTTFPGGEMILKLARAADKFGLWALPEASYDGSNFLHSNNSFCGINMFASILKNYVRDVPYKWFFGRHDDERFLRRLTVTIKSLSAIKKMSQSRVALVGGIAPGFNDLYFDERLAAKRFGVDIRRGHEFSEIKERAYAYSNAEAKELAAAFAEGSRKGGDVTDRHMEMSGRYYQAYVDFCRDNDIDALAVSCWPQIKPDILACSIIGKLNENGIPASCEGDLPGAVSQLFLHAITGKPTALMDMAGFDEADDTVLMWHCGPAPASYANACGNCLTCSYQPNLAGETLSYGLINNMEMKPGPVMFTRFTGEWDKLFLAGGTIAEGKKSPDGSRGWVGGLSWNRRNVSALDFTNSILVNGFQHHYPMTMGDVSQEMLETAGWLGLTMLPFAGYEEHLQMEKGGVILP